MSDSSRDAAALLDFEPEVQAFYDDVVTGLAAKPRSLPCKYFYDQRGSQLFDQICDLEEYYLTRTESAIMARYGAEMAAQIGPGVMLVEYGSGSSIKTRILLDHLESPVAYAPVDISRDHLIESANELSRRFPAVEVLPVCADFTETFELPDPTHEPTHNAVYFPGSTIGNFTPDEAEQMLRQIVELCGCGGGLLIGVDLQKDRSVIEAAYNDSEKVTDEFNLNLLHRMNNELNADIRVDQFKHRAIYNEEKGRVEISLVSQCDQVVQIGDAAFELDQGESIQTEYSHKYTIEGFAQMAASAGLTLRKHWTDDAKLFGVMHFVAK
ncbi:MAG: L-histidine N(alpha)-methyltransferase [Planctomycetota bacterium]